jgi:hypothetical protein
MTYRLCLLQASMLHKARGKGGAGAKLNAPHLFSTCL